MKRLFIELTFYETYYFANIVKDLLEHPDEDYDLDLKDFYGEDRCLSYTSPFPRFSAFHSFIRFVIDNVISDDGDNIKLDMRQDELAQYDALDAPDPHPSDLPVNLAMQRFNIEHQAFEDWLQQNGRTFLDARSHDVAEYYDHLREQGQFDKLLDRATAEVFFVLFQNRNVLLLFNDMMAAEVQRAAVQVIADTEVSERFARQGVLRRSPIPKWARRAVYFRDRGICVLCHRDLSGVLSIGSEENYDHVVPLARGGLNDVTNIQLLCFTCNSKKRMGEAITSNHYEAWYEMKDHPASE